MFKQSCNWSIMERPRGQQLLGTSCGKVFPRIWLITVLPLQNINGLCGIINNIKALCQNFVSCICRQYFKEFLYYKLNVMTQNAWRKSSSELPSMVVVGFCLMGELDFIDIAAFKVSCCFLNRHQTVYFVVLLMLIIHLTTIWEMLVDMNGATRWDAGYIII